MSPILELTHKEAWGTFLVAHASLTRKIDKVLQAEGLLSFQVYDVLLALEDAPDSRLRMSDLAEVVVFDPSSVTRLIDRLEAQGLVRRVAHPTDRRSVFACITEKGLEARKRTWPRYSELIQEHFGRFLTEADALVMRDGLMRTLGGNARLEALGFRPPAHRKV
jgi:DNA-binding MarR family transcriptional regulator